MDDREWSYERVLETMGNTWQAFALQAAVKLDVFSAICRESLSAEAVARRLKADLRGIATLLDALCAMKLLVKEEGIYRTTAASAALLCKDSSRYLGHIIMHHHHLAFSWLRLDEAAKAGRPLRTDRAERSKEEQESFLMGMFDLALPLAPRVAEMVDLSQRRRLLDLGGGPGTYAIHFCLKNPELKATVYDLASTQAYAQKTIERFGLSDRISFQEGNYLEDPVPGGHDVAWLSQILHSQGTTACAGIISKAVAALDPGGMLLVHEFILNDAMDGPLFPALFSLNMLLLTAQGQSYTEAQLREMLAQAGVKDLRRLSFQGPNGSGIIAGVV